MQERALAKALRESNPDGDDFDEKRPGRKDDISSLFQSSSVFSSVRNIITAKK
jgi:hypothetical protein